MQPKLGLAQLAMHSKVRQELTGVGEHHHHKGRVDMVGDPLLDKTDTADHHHLEATDMAHRRLHRGGVGILTKRRGNMAG